MCKLHCDLCKLIIRWMFLLFVCLLLLLFVVWVFCWVLFVCFCWVFIIIIIYLFWLFKIINSNYLTTSSTHFINSVGNILITNTPIDLPKRVDLRLTAYHAGEYITELRLRPTPTDSRLQRRCNCNCNHSICRSFGFDSCFMLFSNIAVAICNLSCPHRPNNRTRVKWTWRLSEIQCVFSIHNLLI